MSSNSNHSDTDGKEDTVPLHAAPTRVVASESIAAASTPEATRLLEDRGASSTVVLAAPASTTEASPTRLAVGTTLGERYVLEALIGAGGMGMVYKARDLLEEGYEDRNPYLALKVLSPSFAKDVQMRMALQREAKKAKSLAHPNIATVYSFDRAGDVVYVTMELLQGKTLKEVIQAHPDGVSRSQAEGMIRGMCLGLAYAHRKGIVHSDFKAGNIFYTEAKETKILDFGIARAVPRQESGAAVADETRFDVGTLGGLTPSYASPEMLAGQVPQLSDDVFALGIVTYQLLVGRHPFDYVPVDELPPERRTPKYPAHLTRRQKKALAAALSMARANRPKDAADFLSQLEGRSRMRLVAASAVVGCLLLSGYLLYEQSVAALAARPDVPFATLSAETQAAVTGYLADGRQAQRFEDYGSAIDLYLRAYRLHPRNPDAVAAFDDLFVALAGSIEQARGNADRQIMLSNLEQLGSEDAFLASRTALKNLLEQLQ